jgi:hypothetical protein
VLTLLIASAITLVWIAQTPLPYTIDDVGDLTGSCAVFDRFTVEYGPVYRGLYCAFSLPFPDLMLAFDMKQAAVIVLLGMLAYGLLRRYAVMPLVAAGFALWFVLTLLRFNGTSEFAFLLALAACLSAARGSTPGWAGFFLLMTAAFLVRPEYLLGIVGGIGVLLPLRWLRALDPPTAPRPSALPLFVGGVCLLGCSLLYVSGSEPGSRSWVAFGQHFALNYQQAHRYAGETWSEWETVIAQEFPTSQSVAEAARENPTAFTWHLGYNAVRRFPGALITAVLPTALHAESALMNVLRGGPLLIGLIALAGLGLWKGGPLPGSLRPVLALAPIPLTSFLVMPGARHLLPWAPLLLVGAAWGVQWLLTCRAPWRTLTAGIAGGVLLIGLAGTLITYGAALTTPQPSLRAAVNMLRQEATPAQPVRLLTAFGSNRLCALVGDDRCVPLEWRASDVPSDYAADTQPNWILVSADWQQRTAVQNDPLMRRFLSEPQAFGCQTELVTRDGFDLLHCTPAFRLP